MKTQFIIVDIDMLDDTVLTTVAPAKFIKCECIMPEQPGCSWCQSKDVQPCLDIIQHEMFSDEDRCWTVFRCLLCLNATVYVYELTPVETPVPVIRG